MALGLIGVYLGKEGRIFFCWVSELNSFSEVLSEHQSQLQRLGHLWLGAVTAGTRNSRTFQDSIFIDELDSVVRPHTESRNLPFCTSDARFSDVSHCKEFHSEVGHC